ncbi:MAG: class I SAM-dependent methyltransferase [Arcobacter sp.]|jgi:ubiquinone/menaquinone biosynthesis C-methylase UbiE|uniref:class I SAM-dependent methyltransferase n=1 Tax=Arcobacter sp. TaxID=1872629 RepID=UPI002591054C|nr:class I SAM-dependent methyltransferase [Arcobacter sp.]MDD3007882.1 class I SAM-dependent methyltransferase [Arcobacter sp.]MDY3204801.1 class I SAM-dependent methyltransferase [Arcobacter sp.]
MNNWIYDEFKHCGVNYSDLKEVEEYDEQHQKFRNFQKEVDTLLEDLNFSNSKELTVIDFGCGTGAFEIYASKYFKKIYAIDTSKAMLEVAKNKAFKENILNVEYIHSGFLNYKNKDSLVDLVTTKMAFHHLPDFWKQIALFNINKTLKIGGILYISDIVF